MTAAPNFAAIAAMPANYAKVTALVDALRHYGLWAGHHGMTVTVDMDRMISGPPPSAPPPPKPDSRITQIKAWRELHRWGLAETKWLLERADVDFNLDRATEVVAAGYTEALALAELRAAYSARR